MLDLAAPAAAIGYGVGRIGCLTSGDGDYGMNTTLPWGVHMAKNALVPPTPPDALVQPTPVYEFLFALVLGWLLWRLGAKARPMGWLTGLYLVLSGLARFLVEFVRINPRLYWGMSNAQVAALGSVVVGVVVMAGDSAKKAWLGAGGGGEFVEEVATRRRLDDNCLFSGGYGDISSRTGCCGAAKKVVGDEAADDGSEDGCYPEEPELTECPAADEDRGAGAAGGVDRGVGDRDADEVDQREAEADGDGSEAFGGALVGGAEDDEEEEGGEEHLDEEAGEERVVLGGVVGVAVGGESAGEGEGGVAAGDEVEDSGGADGAEDLGDDVGGQLGCWESVLQ